MKVLAAIDSFKGSMTSLEAGKAVEKGVLRADPYAEVCVCPIADGGEGTTQSLIDALGGSFRKITVTGPAGQKVGAVYGLIPEEKTAVIEMSSAAGITLVSEAEKNPLHTTTYGVGEMIRDAISCGCRSFIIGIGGSATNDGGAGMLQALGFDFLDNEGKNIPFGAEGVGKLAEIRTGRAMKELKECSFLVACDVTNPLCGDNGASAVFGPQKGADPAMVKQMDHALAHYAELTKKILPDADPEYPGTGAAGGLGFAFLAFLHASLRPGIEIIMQKTKIEEKVKEADIVVTGEGRMDSQTVMGKTPSGVASLAVKYGKPVVAFAGSVADDAGVCNENGIDAFFPILRKIVTLDDAMNKANAMKNLADTAEQVFRLIRAVRKF